MGKFFDSISEDHAAWIRKQHIFFCATAPISAQGTVNTSPKGYDSFRIIGPNQVCYLDLTGNHNSRIAHSSPSRHLFFETRLCSLCPPSLVFSAKKMVFCSLRRPLNKLTDKPPPSDVCLCPVSSILTLGSGIETLSHLQENGRITFLFMEFEGAPRILRLFGQGHFARVDTPEFETLYRNHFDPQNCASSSSSSEDIGLDRASQIRGIVVADIHKVGTSCGWGVPYYEFKGERPTLKSFWGKKTREQLGQYWRMANTESLDGLPALRHELMGPDFAPTEEDGDGESEGGGDEGGHLVMDSSSNRNTLQKNNKMDEVNSSLISRQMTPLGSSTLVAAGFCAGLAASALFL